MRDWFAAVAALTLSSSCIVGCGGSGAVDFFEGAGGRAGSTASGGSVNGVSGSSFVNGGSSFVSGGSSFVSGGSAGSVSTLAGGATQSGPSDVPCSPAMDGTNGMSGPFGTLGESCWRVSTDIAGWGCSNFEGRTVKVNGTAMTCAQLPLPDKLHGDYYFDFSAGEHEYASFFWF